MNFRLTPRALRDVSDIGDRIAIDDPRAAQKLVGAFRDCWRLLANYPFSGRSRDDLTTRLRQVFVKPYICFYFVEDSGVLIARVFHVRQNISAEDFEE